MFSRLALCAALVTVGTCLALTFLSRRDTDPECKPATAEDVKRFREKIIRSWIDRGAIQKPEVIGGVCRCRVGERWRGDDKDALGLVQLLRSCYFDGEGTAELIGPDGEVIARASRTPGTGESFFPAPTPRPRKVEAAEGTPALE